MRTTAIFRLWLMTIVFYGFLCQTTLTVLGTGIVENETASIWMAGYGENYGFGAHALDNWEIISASLSGNSGGNWVLSPFPPPTSTYPARSVSAAGTRKAGWDTAQMFSATLSGAIRPIGPGSGSATYTYRVTADWSTSTLLLDPYQAIVPLGSNGSFALKWLDVACIWHYVDNPYWKCLDNVQTTWQHGLPTPLASGEYIVKASPHPDDGDMRTSYLTVVGVASLLPNEGTESDDGDNNNDTKTFVVSKAATGVVTVTATPNPNISEPNLPAGCAGEWTLTSPEGTGTGKLQRTVSKTTAGTTTLTCTCGTSSKTTKIAVIEVEKIQYKIGSGDYADVPNPLIVAKGADVNFKAIKSPAVVTWPSGKPVWGGEASGTGETTSVTFNTTSINSTDYKTVTAECGNTVTANVIVFDFEGTLTPVDDFDQRSKTKYGLYEQVVLDFTTIPEGITASQAGGLRWMKSSGVGAVSNAENDDGTADYDAQVTAGAVTLRLTNLSSGIYKSYSMTVVAPSGTRMTRVNINVFHTKYTASAGIALYYWLDPKDVSFTYLSFGEGSCAAENTTGIFVSRGDHEENEFGEILGGDITNGCRVSLPDQAWESRNPWFPGGTFTWNIPTQYIVGTTFRYTFGNNQPHTITIYDTGFTRVDKDGQAGWADVNDESSSF